MSTARPCIGIWRKRAPTFSAIVDAVRTELANRYIANRERPLSAVAEMLGFSHSSAFSRWFKKRFGRSVSAWRATNQVKL